MSFDMDELSQDSTDQTDSDENTQRKTLVANMYSNRGILDGDSYKELDDWGLDEDDISLSYNVTKANGLVRNTLKSLAPSGNHEEWYAELQVGLAHRIAQLKGRDELPDGREVEGAVPIMEQVSITGGDIMDYLREHPECIEDLDSAELAQLREEHEEEQEEEEEAAAAEADD